MSGGWAGTWPLRRSAAQALVGISCLLLVATPSVAVSTPRGTEPAGGASPRPAGAASDFAALAAGRTYHFSPALEARLSAGVPRPVEATRSEPIRQEALPPRPVVDLAALRGDLQGAAERHAGRYGVVVFDPDSRGGVSLGGHETFTAASVGKLATLLTLYRAAARGELHLDDKISILPEDYRSYGTGVLHNRAPGTEITLRECAYYLVNKSDNTAWEMLDRRLGVAKIQAEMEDIGARSTDYDMGITTPEDVFLMLQKINDPSFTDGELSGEMVSAMTHTAFEDRIPASLPPDVRVAHKIGSYADSFGDAGVVFYKDHTGAERRYFIVVLSGETAEGSARAAIQEMSRIAYRHLAVPAGRAPLP